MTEYDQFAETYQHWSATASPYSVIETYTFLQVLGSVRGLDILDLAAGEGRTSRMLMGSGAASVLGADISPEMVRRATEQNTSQHAARQSAQAPTWPNLRYMVLDARDAKFQLDSPVDVVTAMYLFHYAPNEDDLEQMAP
jgi:toxoflavin synthase